MDTPHARLLVLLEVFDGQKSFDKWVSHFENVSTVNGWNDNDKLLWLKVRLTEKAQMAFAQLAHETQQSYATAKQALIDRFDPPSKQQLYKVKLELRGTRRCGRTSLMNCFNWLVKHFRSYKRRYEWSWH